MVDTIDVAYHVAVKGGPPAYVEQKLGQPGRRRPAERRRPGRQEEVIGDTDRLGGISNLSDLGCALSVVLPPTRE